MAHGFGGLGTESAGFCFANGFDGLGARPPHQHDGAAFETEGAPHFARQIFFILVRKQIFAVDEQEKSGRRLPDLRGVKEL